MLIQAVKPRRVAEQYLLAILRRDAGERALDHLPGIGIGRGDVREVGFPHDVVDADQLAQLDADGLEPEVHINLPAKLIARPRLDAFAPEAPTLPFVVARFED